MKFKRLILAVMACALLLAVMPGNIAAIGETGQYPSVMLSFERDTNDPTSGTLNVESISFVPGNFIYSAGTSTSVFPQTSQYISQFGKLAIKLTNIPVSSPYYISYYTYYSTQSSLQVYTIPAYTGGNNSAVTILSSSRSGTDVNLNIMANEPCRFYYSVYSDMQDSKSFSLITTGVSVPQILPSIQSNLIYYRTQDFLTQEYSSISSFTVGSQGGGFIPGSYPVLSSYNLYTATGEYATFSYTSDKAGYLLYTISQTPVYSITVNTSIHQQINNGAGSFIIPVSQFASTSSKMYFVTIDGNGNQSQVMSVSLNAGSGTTGYPTLTSSSFVSSAPGYGTFNYTSNKEGYIYYMVSAAPVASVTPTGNSPLNLGSGSFTITDSNLLLGGSKIYYVTVDTTGQYISPVQSVSIGSGTPTSYPTISNMYFSVSTQMPLVGTLTFTSNMSGYLMIAASVNTNVTKSSEQFSYYPITAGANTITVTASSGAVPLIATRLYYYTANSGAESQLTYILPNSMQTGTNTTISSVAVTNVAAPVAGAMPTLTYTIANNNRFSSTMEWYNPYNMRVYNYDKFQWGNQYFVEFTLNANPGYSFPSNASQFSATVNGKAATIISITSSTVKFRYGFDNISGKEITSVQVNGITEPVAGETPDTTGTPGDNTYYISNIVWQPITTKFVSGGTYTVNVTLVPATGYTFNTSSNTASMRIGTQNASLVSAASDGSLIVISYTYTASGSSQNNDTVAWENPFTDVKEYDVEPSASNPNGVKNRYYVYIKYCYLNNLFYGTSTTTFSPSATMNRAMFVTVLGRLAGVDVTSYKTNKFKDVVENSWYAPYVAWAEKNGIVLGYGNNSFGPSDPVTREQMCEFLRRYAKYAGIPLGYTEKSIGFSDSAKISSWAKEAISIFEQAGVAVSKPNTAGFEPTVNAKRQEIAEILILFMMKYMNG